MSGTLHVVATPIGNLEDLTPRARQTLAEVSLIAAEDTRHTGRLLMHIGCKTRLLALHDHNEEKVVGSIIKILLDGNSVALVSDAGTPLVSDPGFRLVREAHKNNIVVSPIPGASAVTAALSSPVSRQNAFVLKDFCRPNRQRGDRRWRVLPMSDEHWCFTNQYTGSQSASEIWSIFSVWIGGHLSGAS